MALAMIRIYAAGISEGIAEVQHLEAQLPFAAALALTWTAKDVEAALIGEMRSVFDRPTRWTLNSLRVFPATKDRLEARVWMKNEADKSVPATRWMEPEIYGGTRQNKRSEAMLKARGILPEGKYIVPGQGAELDQYGNIKRGYLTKMLSGVGGYTQQGYNANATSSTRSQRRGNAKRFFVMHDARRNSIGIAERTGRGADNLRIVLAFVSRPSYRKAFDFYGIADRVANERLPLNYTKAIAQAVRTRRR